MALTPAQLAALKAKVQGDPALLADWNAGTPVPIADALNDPTNATYAGTVTLPSVPRDAFLLGIAPATIGISPMMLAKYGTTIQLLCAASNVTINATTQALLAMVVADGLLTQAQVNAFTTRAGSWAEVNFGVGAAPGWADVVAAMNS